MANFEPPFEVPEHQFMSHHGGIYRLRAHPKQKDLFASCSVDNTVKIWSTERDSPMRTLDDHLGQVGKY